MPLYKRVPVAKSFSLSSGFKGKTVRIEYAEQGGIFEPLYPIEGEIVHVIEDPDGDWFLVWVDNSFDVDDVTHAHVMFAQRYVGRPLGGSEPAPVAIKLPADADGFQKGRLDLEKSTDMGWGHATLTSET